MQNKMKQLRNRLADERSNTIILVSHCILNENARYLGGAFSKGMVPHGIDIAGQHGYGIVQMPCPEQKAWGGILKKYMWLALGMRQTPLYAFRGMLISLFIIHTKRAYKRIARQVVRDILDYRNSGFTIIGIVGVDGSPSCGVAACLDMKKSFEFFSGLTLDTLDRNSMNDAMYATCLSRGKGLFIAEIEKLLHRKKIHIAFQSHSLLDEMKETMNKQLL